MIKKMISGLLACSMAFSLFGPVYAHASPIEKVQPVNHEHKFRIIKEDFVTFMTFHEISQTLDIEVIDKYTGEKVFQENGASIETVQSWLEKPSQGNRQKRFAFVIPLAWGAAEIAAAITAGLTVVTGIALKVKDYEDSKNKAYYSTKKEIEDAANAIPKKLKKSGDDYAVDTGKFTENVKGSTAKREPKTGWTIEKTKGTPHKGGSGELKLHDKSGKRIASLTKEGKIVGK
ncbi:glucuronyl hydrolase [Paenibacillus alvei]|uniref:glucuronyl hydrolase n=1 Tax=Paenibacillus alvei TaxID=44250 RepID=UPI001FD50E40|nr:glucuronyl hydrolase [Paenibacillus alvei]